MNYLYIGIETEEYCYNKSLISIRSDLSDGIIVAGLQINCLAVVQNNCLAVVQLKLWLLIGHQKDLGKKILSTICSES